MSGLFNAKGDWVEHGTEEHGERDRNNVKVGFLDGRDIHVAY